MNYKSKIIKNADRLDKFKPPFSYGGASGRIVIYDSRGKKVEIVSSEEQAMERIKQLNERNKTASMNYKSKITRIADLSGKGYRVYCEGKDLGELMSIWPVWTKGNTFFEQWNLGEDVPDPETNEALINKTIVVSGNENTSQYTCFEDLPANRTIKLKPGSFKENQPAPDTAEQLLNTPMNPEVKDIRAMNYKKKISAALMEGLSDFKGSHFDAELVEHPSEDGTIVMAFDTKDPLSDRILNSIDYVYHDPKYNFMYVELKDVNRFKADLRANGVRQGHGILEAGVNYKSKIISRTAAEPTFSADVDMDSWWRQVRDCDDCKGTTISPRGRSSEDLCGTCGGKGYFEPSGPKPIEMQAEYERKKADKEQRRLEGIESSKAYKIKEDERKRVWQEQAPQREAEAKARAIAFEKKKQALRDDANNIVFDIRVESGESREEGDSDGETSSSWIETDLLIDSAADGNSLTVDSDDQEVFDAIVKEQIGVIGTYKGEYPENPDFNDKFTTLVHNLGGNWIEEYEIYVNAEKFKQFRLDYDL